MVEFLTSNLESLWSQVSRPSINWGTRCGDMICDGMFGGYRHVAGLRYHWILGQNSFDFISWLLRQQRRPIYIQVNKKFHKFERVYRDCIKRTRDKTRIHCIPHDAPGT